MVYLVSFLPLKVHYFFADILSFLLRYVFRYRSSVIYINLARSFPSLRYGEFKKIYKQVYRNLADIMVEAIWAFTRSSERVAKRITFENYHLIAEALKENKNVMLLAGHQGNWEYYTVVKNYRISGDMVVPLSDSITVYKYLESKFMNRLTEKIRNKHQAVTLYDAKNVLKKIIARKEQGGLYLMLGDQAPPPSGTDRAYEFEFLHQKTLMLSGPEFVSREIDATVFFLENDRYERGKYRIRLTKICDFASQTESQFITREYARLLEESINLNKSNWLWSHRMWKRNKTI